MAKFKLTDETKQVLGYILHRIEATEDFGNVKKGDKGGWIEKEGNLSQNGNAWVCGDAKVFGNAWVFGNAKVYGNAWVCGDAKVFGNAKVYGDAEVYGNAKVYGDAWVCGDTEVCGNAEVQDSQNDYILFKNWWSSGRFFTWTRSNNMWRVGCFYGTGEELIAKAYQDSEKSGREYERVVRYVESILAAEKKEQENNNRQ